MNNFFMRFQQWMQRLMAGRYGTDSLNWALLILYLVFWALGIFTKIVLFPILSWVLLVLVFFPHVFPQYGAEMVGKSEVSVCLEPH